MVGRKPEFILAGNFVYVFLDKNRISQHKTQSGIVLHTYRSMGDRPNRYIVGHGCFCDVAYFIFGGWSRCSDTYFKDGGMKWLIYWYIPELSFSSMWSAVFHWYHFVVLFVAGAEIVPPNSLSDINKNPQWYYFCWRLSPVESQVITGKEKSPATTCVTFYSLLRWQRLRRR